MPRFDGTNGDDVLNGTDFPDEIRGYGGNDRLDGRDSDDQIWGGDGHDVIYGGRGQDFLYGGEGDDEIQSGTNFGTDQNQVFGEGGNDSLWVSHADTVDGGDGIDLLVIGTGQDQGPAANGYEIDIESVATGGVLLLRSGGTVRSIERLWFGGNWGNDRAFGWAYADWLRGAEGDDLLDGRSGDDELDGGPGDDTLIGGEGNDLLHGASGNDILHGGEGDDYLYDHDVDGGDTQLSGGGGDDHIYTSGPARQGQTVRQVHIDAGDGNDTLAVGGGTGIFVTAGAVLAGTGDDYLSMGGAFDMTVDLGSGADTLRASVSQGRLVVTLGDGSDTIFPLIFEGGVLAITDFATGDGGDLVDCTMSGYFTNWSGANPFTTGHLRLVQDGLDVLLQLDTDGEGGAEGWVTSAVLQNREVAQFTAFNFRGWSPQGLPDEGITWTGGDGRDVRHGTIADDVLNGGAGNDELWGSLGDDRLLGGDGDDNLFGGAGNDVLVGGRGADTFQASDPTANDYGFHDVIDYSASDAGITINPYRGNSGGHAEGDVINGLFDEIVGSDFDDSITYLSSFSTRLDGRGGNDQLTCGSGEGFLLGGEGDDLLTGGEGDDLLSGGPGSDRLLGGAGQDIAVFGGSRSSYHIRFEAGQVVVTGKDGRDILIDVEILRFDDGDFDPFLVVCDPLVAGPSSASGKDDSALVLPGSPPGDSQGLGAGFDFGLGSFDGRDPHQTAHPEWIL